MNAGARMAFEEDRAILVAVHEGMKNKTTPNIDLGLDAGAKLFRLQLQKLIDRTASAAG
jgi:vanillate O-demethylase monooxygenase subunit